jgi:ribosomal protein L29
VKDRFKISSREMTKVSEIAKSKKLIARISTILRQREIIEAEKKEAKKESGDKK